MARAGATRNWSDCGIEMVHSTDEDARIGFLVNAYMASDPKDRNVLIGMASDMAQMNAEKQAANPATVLHFSGMEA